MCARVKKQRGARRDGTSATQSVGGLPKEGRSAPSMVLFFKASDAACMQTEHTQSQSSYIPIFLGQAYCSSTLAIEIQACLGTCAPGSSKPLIAKRFPKHIGGTEYVHMQADNNTPPFFFTSPFSLKHVTCYTEVLSTHEHVRSSRSNLISSGQCCVLRTHTRNRSRGARCHPATSSYWRKLGKVAVTLRFQSRRERIRRQWYAYYFFHHLSSAAASSTVRTGLNRQLMRLCAVLYVSSPYMH